MNELVAEFLTSSSSSDDDDLMILINYHRKPKITNFLDVVDECDEAEFRRHFRLEHHVACSMIERYAASEIYPGNRRHGGSPALSAKHDFLTFLWFAANKVALRDVAQRFGVAVSTTAIQIERVMEFLINIAPAVIKFPEDKEQAAADFYNIAQFPGTLGCIDGTSIRIKTPKYKIKSTYVNRHDVPSVTLQGVCDHKKRFIDVCVGAPAKIHDARVFRLSDISTELPHICNDGNFHLIGDAAYPIREWLLVPFRDYGNLSIQQKVYNQKFCSTRVIIENCFGLLKGRFRQLLEIDMHTVNKISKFVTCCCVIHNLCIEFDDQCVFDNFEDNVNLEELYPNVSDAALKRLGETKRGNIMRLINEDP